MTESGQILIDDACAVLRRSVASLSGSGTADEMFAAWLLNDGSERLVRPVSATSRAIGGIGAGRQYRDVAVLGYAVALDIDPTRTRTAYETGLDWLLGRQPFATDAVISFEVDAPALLGIALGIPGASATGERAQAWLAGLLRKSLALPRLDAFDRTLLCGAQYLVDKTATACLQCDESTADLRTALRARGIVLAVSNEEADEVTVLDTIRRPRQQVPLPVHAASQLAAVDWVRRRLPSVAIERPTIEQVIRLLDRVDASLRRWTWENEPRVGGPSAQPVRWEVTNEYHVQNLLWSILSPVFPDLEDEENLPSFGQKHPRLDLGIPSLRTIIEVKFARSGGQKAFAELIGQVAEDASLYRSGTSQYDKIIAFVWDDSRTTEQYAELKQGLLKIEGVIGAVVIPRPSKMIESAGRSSNQHRQKRAQNTSKASRRQ